MTSLRDVTLSDTLFPVTISMKFPETWLVRFYLFRWSDSWHEHEINLDLILKTRKSKRKKQEMGTWRVPHYYSHGAVQPYPKV